jgi:hypothetical protein
VCPAGCGRSGAGAAAWSPACFADPAGSSEAPGGGVESEGVTKAS